MVDEYLVSVAEGARAALESLRRAIKAAAPMAEESISYRIPVYKHRGPLVFFAAFKSHCSFIIVSKSVMKKFSSELKQYSTSGTTIHFSAERPLPVALVEKIVKVRVEENEARSKTQIICSIAAAKILSTSASDMTLDHSCPQHIQN